ncbi:thiol reductant ABC exporter subunit CydC [Neobacillus notoginsengisoli]|uniref:Thiol reductant ABC exporter subunit CydC n=1 Tax=Neobacillus notoginsengisoli TaxID=1578198 RepID=A0A417YZE8_9BACI|nr:thiol reductant ABC exporter subunit CydC [Neobacillus notoginsengisoli]RHW43257.1 thiol reductant ABC exporter subunit CydC [Neobacillus notoginsengisoli]
MKTDKWIKPYILQHRRLFWMAILLGALTILFGGSLMFSSGFLISKSATRPETILLVHVPIVGVRAFGIGRAVLGYVERLTGHQFILKIVSAMRLRLYKIVEPQAVLLRSKFRTGDFLGALADDIEHLQDFYLKTLLPAIVSLAVYTVVILFAGAFSVQFAIVLAFLCGLLVFAGPVVSYLYMRAKNEQMKKVRNKLYLQATDTVFGLSDWLFSGRQEEFIQKHEKQQGELLKLDKQRQSFVDWRDLLQQAILGATVVATVYWATGLTDDGKIPATLIAAFTLAMLPLLESFLPLSSAAGDLTIYSDSIKRLEEMESKDGYEWKDEEENRSQDAVSASIELNSVSFKYETGEEVVSRFTLTVSQGEKVAILGPSGSGKSTLLKLIQGQLLPIEGEILLNGRRTGEMATEISRWISVLNQKAYLFNTSVMNNIRLGNPDATDEEVFEAAKKVGLHEMLTQLPDGYRTGMREAGQRFSGGERQRIALARILLQKTPVVMLDEPTIGLDPITENKLIMDIFHALEGKTLIWVTHHLAGMEKMDRILFMDDGKITLEGTHDELLSESERYRRLYEMDRPVRV